MQPPRSLALVAGDGSLPREIAREARGQKWRVVAMALEGFCDPELSRWVDEIHWVQLGQVEQLLGLFASLGIRDAVFAGGVGHRSLHENDPRLSLDRRALDLLSALEDTGDDAVQGALARELETQGVAVCGQADFVPHLVARPGLLGDTALTPEQRQDCSFGLRVARSLGRLGIGQCAIVRRQRVLAVEAIEGTDAAIRRVGECGVPGAVVVKAARPQQDRRFDLPTVGRGTLRAMEEVGASVLAVEAGHTLVLDSAEMIRRCDAAEIAIVGLAGEGVLEVSGGC